ncbi:MAG TPA: hypothetical protein VF083_06210 [Acidimicrobiia bacterium]
MASSQSLVALVACALILVACTGTTAADDTVAPDVFAPTPSIGDLTPTTRARPAPSTTVDVETSAAYRVDPRTLDPQPELDPIPMSDWSVGVSSPNARWLALLFGNDSGLNEGVRLIDLPEWRVVGEWTQLSGSPMSVSDDGVIHTYLFQAPSPRLMRTGVGFDQPETVAELPSDFSPWDAPLMHGDRIVLPGQNYDTSSRQGTLIVISVDQSTGAISETELPGTGIGAAELVDLGNGQTGVVDSYPAVVWDESKGRILVVHAVDDLVTEFDLDTGEISQHRFGPATDDGGQVTESESNDADLWATTGRTAVLGHDGTVMYVAGSIGGFVQSVDSPTSLTTPSGIVAVDTGSWQIVDRLEAPISVVFMSPGGRHLLATGYTEESGPTTYSVEPSGVFLIDPADLDVIAHHPPAQGEEYLGQISFSQDGTFAYVTSYSTVQQVDVIDLDSGEIVANRTGIQVYGEAAVVVDT